MQSFSNDIVGPQTYISARGIKTVNEDAEMVDLINRNIIK